MYFLFTRNIANSRVPTMARSPPNMSKGVLTIFSISVGSVFFDSIFCSIEVCFISGISGIIFSSFVSVMA